MDCRICELKQRQFVCENCLRVHTTPLLSQTHAIATSLSTNTIPKSLQTLESTMHPARLLRARVAHLQRTVDELKEGLARVKKETLLRKDKIRSMREKMAERRRTLEAVRLQTLSTPSSAIAASAFSTALVNSDSTVHPTTPQPSNTTSAPALTTSLSSSPSLLSLSQSIARARSGLVQELVEVFNVVQVGGRPPIGGKAGTKGEWTIGDLILPVPGDMRRYPPDHINAVLTHTIHFLSLLTFYLGVKLPFEIIWTGNGKLGVGQPWIGACRGGAGEWGGWARWCTKHPLHVSSANVPAQPPDAATAAVSGSGSGSKSKKTSHLPARSSSSSTSSSRHAPTSTTKIATRSSSTSTFTPSSTQTQTQANLAESHLSESHITSTPTPTPSSFTTALSMLLYNVSYLAWTQNVDVPLSQAGEVLGNLWGVCCSSELGRKSHESYPHLAPPTPPSFPLDFAQLVQATTANPAQRSRGSAARYPGVKPSSVHFDSNSNSSAAGTNKTGTGTGTGTGKRGLGVRGTTTETVLEEEEEEWDLVDDDAYDV